MKTSCHVSDRDQISDNLSKDEEYNLFLLNLRIW